jgi:multidrug resistance protein MdtO
MVESVAELLKPTPERIRFAARLALICALTTWVTAIYQLPDAALTAYVAFFLNRPERTTSLILCIAFTVVITVVIGLVFLLARQIADDPMLHVISISVLSFVFLFLGSASKLRPIAGTVALIAAYALDLLGNIQTGEIATRALLYAWLFVGVPAGVSFVVNLLLAPAPRTSAERAIAQRLEVAAAYLRDAEGDSELRTRVQEGNGELLTLLKLAKIERSAPAEDLACLHQAVISSWAILNAVYTEQFRSAQIAGTLEEMAAILRSGGYPVEITLTAPASEELRDAITGFAVPIPASPAAPAEKGSFLAKDAFTNPEHVQYAVKATAAAVFCYLLYSLLDWPGIHTAFLTVFIVAQMTAAESVEKLTLRIAGCVVGAAIGIASIVYVTPYLTSIEDLMMVVFVGALGAAYVAAGSPRVSYAGFQIAFAFFLCVIQGAGPATDMVVARDRVIGILLGNVVAYVAFAHIWPISVTRRIDTALAAAIESLGRVARAQTRTERRSLAATTEASLTAIDTDIELAAYEPPAIRSSTQWLASRRQKVDEARGQLRTLQADVHAPV